MSKNKKDNEKKFPCMIKANIDTLRSAYASYRDDYRRFIEYAEKLDDYKTVAKYELIVFNICTIIDKLDFLKKETNVLFLPANRYYNLFQKEVDLELFD